MIKKIKIASLIAAGLMVSSSSFALSMAAIAPCQMGQVLIFRGAAFIPVCVGTPISNIAGALTGSVGSAVTGAVGGAIAGAVSGSGSQPAQPADPCKGGFAAGGLCPADWNGNKDFSKIVGSGGMRFQTVSCDDWSKTHPMVNPENGPFPVDERGNQDKPNLRYDYGGREFYDRIDNGWYSSVLSYQDIAGYDTFVNGAAVLRFPVLKNSDGTEIEGTPTILASGQCDKIVNPTAQSPGGLCAVKADGTFASGKNCSVASF